MLFKDPVVVRVYYSSEIKFFVRSTPFTHCLGFTSIGLVRKQPECFHRTSLPCAVLTRNPELASFSNL